jgi:pyruvate,water dikinase
MREAIAWFDGLGIDDRPIAGGKGASLGELTRAGIAVPPGFVVTTHAFERFLVALEQREAVRAQIGNVDPADLDSVSRMSGELRRRIEAEPMPAEVEAEIRRAIERLGDVPVAVRSSATTEDAVDASFAGLQDTFLWVLSADEAIARIRECWGSLYSVESIAYRRQHGLPEDGVAMAVVVQTMVDARAAGVMFTRSPTSGDKSVVTIEGAWGLGSSVVSGEVTPDRWVVGKITGEITVRDISDKRIMHAPSPAGGIEERALDPETSRTPCLTDSQLLALRDLGRKAERHYGRAQDIEWAVDGGGNILLLQSRPETVWSARDTAPVKAPEADPLRHVMTIFGGRR